MGRHAHRDSHEYCFFAVCHGFTLVRPFLWIRYPGQWCDDVHVWLPGSRGNSRFTFTYGLEDSFEINTSPEKQIRYTLDNRDSQTSNYRVNFSMPVISEISVGLHFSCFGQTTPALLGVDVVRALDVIPDAMRGKVHSRRLQVLSPATTLPSRHLAWDLRKSPHLRPQKRITTEMDDRSSGPQATLDVQSPVQFVSHVVA